MKVTFRQFILLMNESQRFEARKTLSLASIIRVSQSEKSDFIRWSKAYEDVIDGSNKKRTPIVSRGDMASFGLEVK